MSGTTDNVGKVVRDSDINRSTGEFEKIRERQRVEFSELVKKLVKKVKGNGVPFPENLSLGK